MSPDLTPDEILGLLRVMHAVGHLKPPDMHPDIVVAFSKAPRSLNAKRVEELMERYKKP